MTSIIAMKPFQEQFGVKAVGTGAAVIFSLYVVYVSPLMPRPRSHDIYHGQ